MWLMFIVVVVDISPHIADPKTRAELTLTSRAELGGADELRSLPGKQGMMLRGCDARVLGRALGATCLRQWPWMLAKASWAHGTLTAVPLNGHVAFPADH